MLSIGYRQLGMKQSLKPSTGDSTKHSGENHKSRTEGQDASNERNLKLILQEHCTEIEPGA